MDNWLGLVLKAIAELAKTAADAMKEEPGEAHRRVAEVWVKNQTELARAEADRKAREKYADADDA